MGIGLDEHGPSEMSALTKNPAMPGFLLYLRMTKTILLLFLPLAPLAQTKADSLYLAKNYAQAGACYLDQAQHQQFRQFKREDLYNASCCYALAGKSDSAMTLLRLAIQNGYKNIAHIKEDTDLSSLHQRSDWGPLITPLEGISFGTPDPTKARVVTTDVDHFWKAYDLAQKDTVHRTAIYRQYYFDPGSDALQDYFSTKVKSIDRYIAAHDRKQAFYASIRKNTSKVEAYKPAMIQAFVKLKDLYPEAYFPDVTFVIGAFTSAGTTSSEAVIIGLDQAVRSPDIPMGELSLWERNNISAVDKLPNLVAHEMVHANQGGIQYDTTLLCDVLIEGMADFLGEKISGSTANARLHVWAKGREQRIWADFKKEMYLNRANNWIANSNQETPDHPADLGYWVGYQICKAYYDKSPDKKAAVREMLNFKDSKAFYEKSGLNL